MEDKINYTSQQISVGPIKAVGKEAIAKVTDAKTAVGTALAIVGTAALCYAAKHGFGWIKKKAEIKLQKRTKIEEIEKESKAKTEEYNQRRQADEHFEDVKSNLKREEKAVDTDEEIRLHKAKTDIDDESYERRTRIDIEKKKALHEIAKEHSKSSEKQQPQPEKEAENWSRVFHAHYRMPQLPPIFEKLMSGVPSGFKDGMLIFLLNTFSALCVSKARARYNDGELHAPNFLQLIIAPPAFGKDKFRSMFERVFKRVIDADRQKQTNTDAQTHHIVQIISYGISQPKLFEYMAQNDDTHMFMWNPELYGAVKAMEKQNGITYEYLRKSYENNYVSRDNMSDKSTQGAYKLYLNCAFAGTKEDCDKFVAKDNNGGVATRAIFCDIPKPGRKLPVLTFPDETEMESIYNEIDALRKQYCYQTDDIGNDLAAEEQELNLEYVNKSLLKWIDKQWRKAQKEHNNAREIGRIRAATNAFHSAIVAHILFGCPAEQDAETRKSVVNLAIYIANYCIERYIFMFPDPMAQTNENSGEASDDGINQNRVSKNKVIDDSIKEEWVRLKEEGWTWGEIAEEYGYSKNYIKTTTKRYRNRQNIK